METSNTSAELPRPAPERARLSQTHRERERQPRALQTPLPPPRGEAGTEEGPVTSPCSPPHNQLCVSGPTCAASRGRSRGRGIPWPGSSRRRASPGQPRPGRSRSPAAATRGRARASAPGMRGELGPAPAPERALREPPGHGEAAPALLLSDSRLGAWAAQLPQVPGRLGGKA